MNLAVIKESKTAYLTLPKEDAEHWQWNQAALQVIDMDIWCRENGIEVQHDTNRFKFESEEDLLMFVMRWA